MSRPKDINVELKLGVHSSQGTVLKVQLLTQKRYTKEGGKFRLTLDEQVIWVSDLNELQTGVLSDLSSCFLTKVLFGKGFETEELSLVIIGND